MRYSPVRDDLYKIAPTRAKLTHNLICGYKVRVSGSGGFVQIDTFDTV